MSPEELERFVAEPRAGCLATNRPDGFPHLSPIWFLYQDDTVFMELAESRLHLANLRRDPRASLMVDVDERPTHGWRGDVRGVVFRGPVELIDDEATVAAYGELIDRRYLGTGAGDPELAAATEPERYTLVRLTPSATVSWDFRKTGARVAREGRVEAR
jgi:PPOX class probable F420-dependent enzyme